ncbi:hypothetical protein BpHYR1_048757 [Brachionus plicatilis]|uniref:Uncharacterized protein n=1 Tax=Brachionus plicatilis TaxID=10195 RepID=A0A3M7QDH3_BRAPC|nr:hypothetical protein BpHYR1_048757 [Brachionus plicatilis]
MNKVTKTQLIIVLCLRITDNHSYFATFLIPIKKRLSTPFNLLQIKSHWLSMSLKMPCTICFYKRSRIGLISNSKNKDSLYLYMRKIQEKKEA